MSVEIILLIWGGGVLALATFVLIGRLTNGYERSFLGPVSSIVLLVLAIVYAVGLHYLPPLFPTLQPPLLDLGLRMLIALVVAVPIYLSLFSRVSWGWLIPFAVAIQILGPLVAQYLLASAATAGSPPDASTLHLTVAVTVALSILPAVLAFLALRRHPF